MDTFLIIYRVIALGIVAFWIAQIAIAIRKPPDWQPPRAETFPFRISRNLYLIGGVIGIVVGLAIFALSFVLFP